MLLNMEQLSKLPFIYFYLKEPFPFNLDHRAWRSLSAALTFSSRLIVEGIAPNSHILRAFL
jgi:hypothetical protein